MRKQIESLTILGLGIALLFACAAGAQIKSPPPTLQGESALHAWSVPGVVSTSNLATLFSCTNTLTTPEIVGVELFGPAGGPALNDASATSLDVAPGGTVLFSTQLVAGFSTDANLAALVSKGSARVLTTATFPTNQRILCSAFVSDILGDPPTSMLSLNVIRRNVQTGK